MNIRPGKVEDALGIAAVHITCQKQVYRAIFPDHLLNATTVAIAEASKRDKLLQDQPDETCTFVAVIPDGTIVGYATGGPWRDQPSDYAGELYNIFILPEYQGQGIGSRLFLRVVDFLRAKGNTSLLLWVTLGTDAVAYYEHLSGEFIDERQENVAGYTMNLRSYGWRDLDALRDILAQWESKT